MKVHPGSSDPPGVWTIWEEYLQLKPGKFTPNQIVAVITHNQLWPGFSRCSTCTPLQDSLQWLVTLITLGVDNPGERWRQALLDFTYCNVCFDIKQLIKVLCCDLQVTIHQGLVEAQVDILKAFAGFIDHFHIEVTTLSTPQVHALLNHMPAQCAGSHSFLAAIR